MIRIGIFGYGNLGRGVEAAIKQNSDKTFNVVIRPAVPAYALQLSYQSDEIIKRINKYFGYNAVSKISFRK